MLRTPKKPGPKSQKLTLCTARALCQATDLWIDASHSAQTMYKDFGHFPQPNNGPNVAQMRRNRPIGKIDKKNLGQMQVLRFTQL